MTDKKNVISDIKLKDDFYWKNYFTYIDGTPLFSYYKNLTLEIGYTKERRIDYLLDIYKKVVDSDTQIETAINTRKHLILERFLKSKIVCDSEDKNDIEARDFVNEAINRIQNLEQKIITILDSLIYGFTVTEIIYYIDKLDNKDKIFCQLMTRPSQIFSFNQDQELVYIKNISEVIKLEQNKFIVHRHNANDYEPFGQSEITTGLYWLYWFKKMALKYWVEYLETYAKPKPIFIYDPNQATAEDLEKLALAIANMKEENSFMIPNYVDAKMLKEITTATSNDSYKEFEEYVNKEIQKKILKQTLTSDVSSSGSRSLGEVQKSILDVVINTDTTMLINTLNDSLVRPLVDLNFENIQNYPYFWIEETKDQKAQVEFYKVVINDLKLPVDIDILYEDLGLQKPENYDEIIKKETEKIEENNEMQNDNIDETSEESEDEDESMNEEFCYVEKKGLINTQVLRFQSENDFRIYKSDSATGQLKDWINYTISSNAVKHFNFLKKQITKTIKTSNSLQEMKNIQFKIDNKDLKELLKFEEKMYLLFINAIYYGAYIVNTELNELKKNFQNELFITGKPFTFEEASRFYADKLQLSATEITEISDESKIKSFWVTRASTKYITDAYYRAVEDAISRGTTLEAFKIRMNNFFTSIGMTQENPFYLETVFRTNIQQAYNFGRYAQMTNPTVKKIFGYWTYRAVGDERTRIEHSARDGVTLPADDDWWNMGNYPPIDFNCRCTVLANGTKEVKDGEVPLTDKKSDSFKTIQPVNKDKYYYNPKDFFKEEKYVKEWFGEGINNLGNNYVL